MNIAIVGPYIIATEILPDNKVNVGIVELTDFTNPIELSDYIVVAITKMKFNQYDLTGMEHLLTIGAIQTDLDIRNALLSSIEERKDLYRNAKGIN